MIVPSLGKLAPLLGISKQALSDHKKAGKFSEEPSGGYDPDKVRAALKKNRDTAHPSKIAAERTQDPDTVHEKYNAARAHREVMAAKRAELDLKERTKELLERSEVSRLIGDMIITAKTNLRGVGAKIAADLASEDEPAKCQAMVDAEIDEALDEISRWTPPA